MDGSRELAFTQVERGIRKQAWPNVLDYEGDGFYQIWDYVKDYNVFTPSAIGKLEDQMGPYPVYIKDITTNVYIFENHSSTLFLKMRMVSLLVKYSISMLSIMSLLNLMPQKLMGIK
ncbi:MAG: hypothetical protein RR565_10115 [Erysipelothrix sp.]